MTHQPFFIVGPTASGKSDLAADVAEELDAEIVNADAFQIYCGFDQLTAKPDRATLARVPHHLTGTIPTSVEMNAEKFRQLALAAISQIRSRQKLPMVVGGSGLYVKALTHGLTDLPPSDPKMRDELNQMSLDELRAKLRELDPSAMNRVDLKNRRRVVRAVEICLLTGKPASALKSAPARAVVDRDRSESQPGGIFVFREREELYQRINDRVERMFESGVVEEVAATGDLGPTASQMIGLSEIRSLLAGKISRAQCVTTIQQVTRRYAKRQLTWFRRQSTFSALNLSLLTRPEALKWISQKARLASAPGND